MFSKHQTKYQRILLKFSGEVLASEHHTIDPHALKNLAEQIACVVKLGVEVGFVMGAGNLCRGSEMIEQGMKRVTGDQIGMLGTLMNGLALKDTLEQVGLQAKIFSALAIPGMIDLYHHDRVLQSLGEGAVLIFTGGIGQPFFTTDTTACLRGIEIGADLILKATKVDGVYSADPLKDKNAKRYTELTFTEVISKRLQVMDLTAMALLQEHQIPLRVFNMNKPESLKKILLGEEEGTLVRNES